jgi:flagellar biosynthetic protein FlhB
MGNEAAEKTEEATSRRRTKERERGNVAKSKDMESAMVMVGGIALLAVLSKHMYTTMVGMLQSTFSNLDPNSIDIENIIGLMYPYFRYLGLIVIPFFVLLAILAIIVIRMDVGHVFALEKVKIDPQNLSPRKMLENANSAINSRKGDLLGLVGLEMPIALNIVGSILINMIINMCLAMLILGYLDKKYQTYEYEKSIKMTKQEVKDEQKDTEGDPKIKARIKSIQMQMARQRMMSSVPTADVVVTNPTHYAVAIKYDKTKAPAPIVVAKGVDYLAFQIREIAKENNVPIVENRPVARNLYNNVPIDGMIPSDMYVAVAEILAFVFRTKNEPNQ